MTASFSSFPGVMGLLFVRTLLWVLGECICDLAADLAADCEATRHVVIRCLVHAIAFSVCVVFSDCLVDVFMQS
jgi:hypothetical protein